jgi:transposase
VTQTHRVETLRRWKSNYSAGPSSAHGCEADPFARLKLSAMLTFNGNLKVYVALEPCDMRKSFNTLVALARNYLGLDSLSGAALLFTNKSRRLIKILYFEGTGYWLVAKRLEKGTFSWPQDIDGDCRKLMLKPTALAMLTDSIDLRDGLQRPWYGL